jgi:apolipoprotein N-acyltransferase
MEPRDTFGFSASQKEVIKRLVKYMGDVSQFWVVMAIISLVYSLSKLGAEPAKGLRLLVSSVLLLIIGVASRRSSKSFKKILDTQGGDIPNLMDALGKLRSALQAQVAALVMQLLTAAFGLYQLAAVAMGGAR